MKKLTTAKIWQFAAGQFGWALLSGIISNWLVYFEKWTADPVFKRRGSAAGTFHGAGVLVTGE